MQTVAVLALAVALRLCTCSALRPPSRAPLRPFRSHSLPALSTDRFTAISHSSCGSCTALRASTGAEEEDGPFDLAAWFNPNTRGGVLVWSALLLIIPVAIYNYFVSLGLEDTKVGAYVGFSFVVLSMVGWASTYLFRVANKDMTYARQLKDYENAVLQKRLEELADDEIQALMEEIDLEEADTSPAAANALSALP